MKGLKASLIVVIITVITCAAIASKALKKTETASYNNLNDAVITGSGTFPGNMFCMYAGNDGIYYCSYGDYSHVLLYSTRSHSSSTITTPIKSEHSISLFSISGNYTVWKEYSSDAGDEEDKGSGQDWELYLKKDTRIIKVDEGRSVGIDSDESVVSPGDFSLYGGYIAYNTCDVSDSGDAYAAVKLYDMENQNAKVIFSLDGVKDKHISNPYVYGDYVVWSINDITGSSEGTAGDIYLYNISTGSCIKAVQGGKFVNPMLWEDYIICCKEKDGTASLVLLNIKTGDSKDIASMGQSLSQGDGAYEYSVGDGYAAWNNSSLDGVYVYDIRNDKTYELDRTVYSDGTAESLINVNIYGKTVVYTDHRFNKDSGTTVSETGKYLILR